MSATLETPRLLLRPFTLADAPRVQHLAGERLVAATTLHIPHPYPDGGAEAWIETHAAERAAGRCINHAVVLAATAEVIGAVGVADIDLDQQLGELGYWIGRPYWRHGYATEAAACAVAAARTVPGLSRIVARCFAGNGASARVLEKIGMAREGRLPRHIAKWGVFEDVLLYGIVFPERGAS